MGGGWVCGWQSVLFDCFVKEKSKKIFVVENACFVGHLVEVCHFFFLYFSMESQTVQIE